MYTKIWRPGTEPELDSLFNSLREQMFNSDHKLAENYNKEHFETCAAINITFDDNDQPFLCSSVLTRPCWPSTAYRIVNRMWKPDPIIGPLNEFSPGTDSMINTQIAWIKENTDCNFIFSSREGNVWMKWARDNLDRQFNLDFKISEHKYLTCPNCDDDRCWQYIIYQGNEEILKQWQRK